eukprot:2347427-Rhodomonas_salina.2
MSDVEKNDLSVSLSPEPYLVSRGPHLGLAVLFMEPEPEFESEPSSCSERQKESWDARRSKSRAGDSEREREIT